MRVRDGLSPRTGDISFALSVDMEEQFVDRDDEQARSKVSILQIYIDKVHRSGSENIDNVNDRWLSCLNLPIYDILLLGL